QTEQGRPGWRSCSVQPESADNERTTMRFVSQYKKFGMQVRPIREMVLATGQTQVQVEPIYIQFWQNDISEKEIAAAEAHWGQFAGRTLERDQVTQTPILNRLSVF